MMYIEFLILRTPSGGTTAAVTALADALKDMQKPSSLFGYWILKHSVIPGDIALMLEWLTEIDAAGSALAQQLKPLLLGLGIVNHSVWNDVGTDSSINSPRE